jgi:hypothetical protein
MPVIHTPQCFNGNYYHDPIRNLFFEDYNDIFPDINLFIGGNPEYDIINNFKSPKYYIDFETPNRFCVQQAFASCTHHKKFDIILTICPYTAKWLKDIVPHRFVFSPYSNRFIKQNNFEKKYDFIFSGHFFGFHEQYLNLLNSLKLNLCVISDQPHRYRTHAGISYQEKLDLYSKSKLTYIINTIEGNYSHIESSYKIVIKNLSLLPFDQNEAFKNLSYGLPQIKTRVLEAAFNKTIMLVKKDPWNIIESYFEPDKEFIYWENEKDLSEKTIDILKNYDKYLYIIENAYKKAINRYTVKHFIEAFVK